MTSATDLATAAVGDELETIRQTASLHTSVAYAGASGDLNPLHYDPDVAAGISPTGGMIAHGMYSMGLVSRVLTTYAGGPERVSSVEVRFTRPWPLGTEASFGGTVSEVSDDHVTVTLWGRDGDGNVLLRGNGVVRR